MIAIGLTGGIASGKSLVSAMLAERGVPVVEADRVGHESYRRGSEAHRRVVEAFGPEVVARDGEIDRRALGARVFADPEARRRLEGIVWPAMQRMMAERLEELRGQDVPVAVLEAAVLIEADWLPLVDEVWLVTVPEDVARQRLISRNGLSAEEADARIRASAMYPSAEAVRKSAAGLLQRQQTAEEEQRLADVVAEYMPLVRHAANRIAAGSATAGILEYEDMLACGVQGLIEAYQSFDSTKGAKFSTYALPRIRGAILDALRAGHKVWQMADETRSIDPDAAAEDAMVQHMLREAVSALPDQERTIVQLYYMHSQSLKSIGKALGISESRASQLRHRAIRRLRTALARMLPQPVYVDLAPALAAADSGARSYTAADSRAGITESSAPKPSKSTHALKPRAAPVSSTGSPAYQQRARRADVIIENSGSLEALREQVERAWAQLQARLAASKEAQRD